MKRNPLRSDELWDIIRVSAIDAELRSFPDFVVLSGGWAWHYMSPKHEEKKILHDHKDVDMLVPPEKFQQLSVFLKRNSYQRIWTKYDKVSTQFYRFEKIIFAEKPVKVLIDVFLEAVPFVEAQGRRVVEPKTLLGFYKKKIHTTDDCIAVVAARKLVDKNINPIMKNELIK